MSKLIKKPIIIPHDVVIKQENKTIYIQGKLGINKLHLDKIYNIINIVQKNNNLFVSLNNQQGKLNKFIKSIVGTIYSLLKNYILGVDKGFSKKIILVGLGYKVNHNKEKQMLEFFLGYSHVIQYNYPKNIKIECLQSTEIIISGIDKQLVGQVAAIICKFRVPDIYKGKGIKYENQIITLKEIKKK